MSHYKHEKIVMGVLWLSEAGKIGLFRKRTSGKTFRVSGTFRVTRFVY